MDNLFTIIGYHHVTEFLLPISKKLYISVADFEKEMDLLVGQGIEFKGLKEVQNYKPSTQKSLQTVLTFDDGYSNFYHHAFPILRRYQLPAVLYVITEELGQPDYCTREMVKEMHKKGIEIGAHTLNHFKLSTLTQEEQWKEIYNSKRLLEELIDDEVTSFCYPYGDYDETTVKLVQKAGFHNAVTTEIGLNHHQKCDWFRLARVASEADDTKKRIIYKAVNGVYLPNTNL